MDNFIDELLRFRAQHNLSMQQLSDLSGVSRTTIFNIESGLSKATAKTQMRLRIAMEKYENKEG